MAIASGTCGSCTWSISDAGLLAIAPASGGSGVLHRRDFESPRWPWLDYADDITAASLSGSIQIGSTFVHEHIDGNAYWMFYMCSNMTSVSGIGSLIGVTGIAYMFYNCSSLTSLDLSVLDMSSLSNVSGAFDGCSVLSSVTFGQGFVVPKYENGSYQNMSFVPYGRSCVHSSSGLVVADNDAFASLAPSERAGTWSRGVAKSFRAIAVRSTGGTADEDGEDAIVTALWATDAATTDRRLRIYKKAASSPSYPSSPDVEQTLTGDSGTASATISDLGDEAFDFRVEFYDGTNTFVDFPSVQSNVRLLTLDESGNVAALGEIAAHDAGGNAHNLTEKVGFDDIYPVGSIYMSVNSTNPQALFGGTWERLTGRFLLAATDNGSSGASQAAGRTGGDATVTLTAAQMPYHRHSQVAHTHTVTGGKVTDHSGSSGAMSANASHSHYLQNAGDDSVAKGTAYARPGKWVNTATQGYQTSSANLAHTHTINHGHGFTQPTVNGGATNTGYAGGSDGTTAAHNNMPPFLAVYMWKRTA